MSGISYMTQGGYDKLRSELDILKTKGRDDAAKAIAEAEEKKEIFLKMRNTMLLKMHKVCSSSRSMIWRKHWQM